MYDQKSRVALRCYHVLGGAKYYKVITSESCREGNDGVVSREMVRPLMGSWVTVCKGKDQDFLCVVTESPRYARRDSTLPIAYHGNPEYYDEVDGIRDGEPYSVLSQTSLIMRRCGDRESIGIGLMLWSRKQRDCSVPQDNCPTFGRTKKRKPRRAKLISVGVSFAPDDKNCRVQAVMKHLDLG